MQVKAAIYITRYQGQNKMLVWILLHRAMGISAVCTTPSIKIFSNKGYISAGFFYFIYEQRGGEPMSVLLSCVATIVTIVAGICTIIDFVSKRRVSNK